MNSLIARVQHASQAGVPRLLGLPHAADDRVLSRPDGGHEPLDDPEWLLRRREEGRARADSDAIEEGKVLLHQGIAVDKLLLGYAENGSITAVAGAFHQRGWKAICMSAWYIGIF